MAPGQYCSVTMTGISLLDAGAGNNGNTNSQCSAAPFTCSGRATCACVQEIEGGVFGCTCDDHGGEVTVTCRY